MEGVRHPGSTSHRSLKAAARTFTAGAGAGFLAGAFVVAALVWQFGNVIGSRADALRNPADPPPAMARWEDGLDDAGGVLEPAPEAPTGTAGVARPDGGHGAVALPRAAPTGDAPVIGAVPDSPKELAERKLEIPVVGVRPEQLRRQFSEKRGATRLHQAIDILAPRNTPVVAVEDGTIARLFLSKAGGITIYQFDPTEQYCYYYAHLERYADGLREGQPVRKGQVIGYVGTTGNAPDQTPHLHFAVFRLTGQKRWWEGTPIDPYDILQ